MITVTMSGSIPREISSSAVTKTVRAVFSKVRRTGKGTIGIRFVGEREIASLNRRYRGTNRPTDVLSFEPSSRLPTAGSPSEKEWGDIVIASAYARREAKRRSISSSEEIIRLVAHGTLHLLGYDHATAVQESRMFRLQEAVVERATLRP